ncbi:MAG TPA: ATP synthase F0 subunit B [Polyangiaceae bacterium]|jgi:F-type H+-transporting ATPase subunit b|nr:ATP synthase F0 subunit B [Polyangiaceae bacterium]
MSTNALRRWILAAAVICGATFALPALAGPEDKAPAAGAIATGEDAKKPSENPENHVISLDEYNWFYGFLGEKEGAEPSILFRPKGMPVPFGALMLNSAILYYLLIRFAKKPIAEALKLRKATILRGMEEAGKMKSDAEARLADYEQKLATIDQEIERVRAEMRATGQAERTRILAEAKEKRGHMERDAQALIEQELKAARETLLAETARGAIRSAETALRAKLGTADQARIADEYLNGLKSAASVLRGKV